jgi:hypothetical protein
VTGSESPAVTYDLEDLDLAENPGCRGRRTTCQVFQQTGRLSGQRIAAEHHEGVRDGKPILT